MTPGNFHVPKNMIKILIIMNFLVFLKTAPLYKMGTFSCFNWCPTTKWHAPAMWEWACSICRNTLLGAPLGPLQNAPPPTPRGELEGGFRLGKRFCLFRVSMGFLTSTEGQHVKQPQEANPALLSVVTFPFIFGMMYGDATRMPVELMLVATCGLFHGMYCEVMPMLYILSMFLKWICMVQNLHKMWPA